MCNGQDTVVTVVTVVRWFQRGICLQVRDLRRQGQKAWQKACRLSWQHTDCGLHVQAPHTRGGKVRTTEPCRAWVNLHQTGKPSIPFQFQSMSFLRFSMCWGMLGVSVSFAQHSTRCWMSCKTVGKFWSSHLLNVVSGLKTVFLDMCDLEKLLHATKMPLHSESKGCFWHSMPMRFSPSERSRLQQVLSLQNSTKMI